MAGMLYLVPTPIGNLGDISARCREILAQADFIAAEDTRVTLRLLNFLEIKKPLVSYYEHNQSARGKQLLERMQAGEVCALVSDAGSPAISDPGEDLVRLCAEAGIAVSAIPGPCAVITALSISGLPTGRFTFEGFLSTAKKAGSSTWTPCERRPAPWCSTKRPISFWPPWRTWPLFSDRTAGFPCAGS